MQRLFLTLVTAGFALGLLTWTPSLQAQTPGLSRWSQTRQPEVNALALREMLIKGLKVTREDEKAYINRIVTLVVKEKLPVAIVYASFRYARTRRPSFPFPYFVFSVETLAQRNHIDMTDDDDT